MLHRDNKPIPVMDIFFSSENADRVGTMAYVGAMENLRKNRLLLGELYWTKNFNNAAVFVCMLVVPVV